MGFLRDSLDKWRKWRSYLFISKETWFVWFQVRLVHSWEIRRSKSPNKGSLARFHESRRSRAIFPLQRRLRFHPGKNAAARRQVKILAFFKCFRRQQLKPRRDRVRIYHSCRRRVLIFKTLLKLSLLGSYERPCSFVWSTVVEIAFFYTH